MDLFVGTHGGLAVIFSAQAPRGGGVGLFVSKHTVGGGLVCGKIISYLLDGPKNTHARTHAHAHAHARTHTHTHTHTHHNMTSRINIH